ncbi:polyphenol oxidase family protein [Arthrobacter sp. 3Tela_A]|uniref:polyphenol oxidase family protein n=1 Tax=Arthrobacter sp. 3Tela_A TaxID=3093743 RepID=UPI003BB4D7EB
MFWWEGQGPEGFRVAFTDTSAGNLALHVGDDSAAVRSRRSALEVHMGIAPASLRFMEQVHSAEVAVAGPAPAAEEVPVADALLSPDGSAPLAVMVADCLPVLFAGPGPHGVVTAAAHAGRRGLIDGILSNTVAAMRSAGAARIQAWIGPGVCGRCYEVPAEMRAEASHLPGAASQTSWGTPALDLPAAALSQLQGLNVSVEAIPGCTMEEPELFSHRRDAPTGRFAGLIWQPR